jgi:hypothetical protein
MNMQNAKFLRMTEEEEGKIENEHQQQQQQRQQYTLYVKVASTNEINIFMHFSLFPLNRKSLKSTLYNVRRAK